MFSQKFVRQRRTDVTTFSMQFEKIERGLLGEAFRKRRIALIAEREGGNKKVSVLESTGEHRSTSSK